MPLQAEPGAVDPALESVQHLDMAGDPATTRADLVAMLRRVDAVGGAGWPDDRLRFPDCSLHGAPTGREALRSVIEEPARLAGIDVDPALADRLVEYTDTGDALPLLAFTLAQLADGVTRGGRTGKSLD